MLNLLLKDLNPLKELKEIAKLLPKKQVLKAMKERLKIDY